MLKKELILRNPLRSLTQGNEEILTPGSFGAVLAHAGVGKTAFLVQLALNAMLRNKKVLHISLDQPVNKVGLWYRELFQDLAKQYQLTQIDTLLEDILPNRFIMTFKVDGFTLPKLEERLTDLTAQDIFHPQMVIIDGFPFGESVRDALLELRRLAHKNGMFVWFTVNTHRHEMPTPAGIPPALSQVDDLFDVIFQLEPKGADIHIRPLKGISADSSKGLLCLDPATMLIKDDH